MKKKPDFIEWAMRHRQIVILITTLMVGFGVYGLYMMPKQEFPSFTVRQGLVVAVYPGATSDEMEEQVAKPLENFIFSYKEVKKRKTYSRSRDGIVFINVELNDNVKNKDEFWSKFKHGVEQFKSSLPAGVLALQVNDDFGETAAILITLESDQKTYRELERYLEGLEDKLRTVDAVANLRRYGLQKEQISVYLDQKKLSMYGIDANTMGLNLLTQGFTTMSGEVDNKAYVAPIHIARSYNRDRDIAEQIVYSDPSGHVIRLKDVARITREYPDPDSYIRNNGKKCILLSMEMRQGNNIVQMGKEVDQILEAYKQSLPQEVKMYKITDQAQVVGDSVSTFLKELLIAIVAVILVVMALMPLKVASVAASTIPISIFISLGLFYAFGIELNTVTLAALIVTLGMIVDNSIVIIDAYLEKIGEGVSRWHAAIASAREFLKSIFSATLAISITFVPFLLTTKGMMNDFLQSFPWAISLILGISLLVAVLLVPFMQYYFIRKGLKTDAKKNKKSFLDIIQAKYDQLLDLCFRWPKTTLGLGVVSVILGVLLFGQLPQKLMPIAERNQFAIEFYLPAGTAIEQTAAVADSMESILRKDKRVVSVTSFIGEGSPRFHTSYAPQLPGSNFAQFIVNTQGNEATVELLDEYADKYTDYFPNARLRFKQLDYSEAASPIEVRVSGDSLTDLKAAAQVIMKRLKCMPNLRMVRTNFEDPLPGVRIRLDEDEATRLGVNRTFLALNMATNFGDGMPLTTVWEKDYPVKVVLKTDRNGKEADYSDVPDVYVPVWGGASYVPLRQVAKVESDWTEGQIVRRNGIRTLSITAEVARNENITSTTQEVQKAMKELSLPEGTTLSYGGDLESDAETLPQIIGALAIAIVIIFFILLFHFRRINMALLIMAAITLTLLGAALGIWLVGVDVSVTAVLGIISLMGILVRNGIIMLDYAEELRQVHKMSVFDAALQAGKRRMRPIFLTSAAASMGVVPMILGKSSMWMPMGTVIFFGTLISMVLVVTVLPVAYWMLFRKADRKGVQRMAANS